MEYGCNLQVHQPRPFFTLIAIIDIWNKLFQHDGEGLRYVLLLVPDICRVLLVGIVDYLTHIERVDRPGGQPAGVRYLHHSHLDSGHPALGGRRLLSPSYLVPARAGPEDGAGYAPAAAVYEDAVSAPEDVLVAEGLEEDGLVGLVHGARVEAHQGPAPHLQPGVSTVTLSTV